MKIENETFTSLEIIIRAEDREMKLMYRVTKIVESKKVKANL